MKSAVRLVYKRAALVSASRTCAMVLHFCYTCDCFSITCADCRSVKQFTDEYKKKGYPLHVLLNNAAIQSPKGKRGAKTEEGFEVCYLFSRFATCVNVSMLPIVSRAMPLYCVRLFATRPKVMSCILCDICISWHCAAQGNSWTLKEAVGSLCYCTTFAAPLSAAQDKQHAHQLCMSHSRQFDTHQCVYVSLEQY